MAQPSATDKCIEKIELRPPMQTQFLFLIRFNQGKFTNALG
jgi:hypothetical protein